MQAPPRREEICRKGMRPKRSEALSTATSPEPPISAMPQAGTNRGFDEVEAHGHANKAGSYCCDDHGQDGQAHVRGVSHDRENRLEVNHSGADGYQNGRDPDGGDEVVPVLGALVH